MVLYILHTSQEAVRLRLLHGRIARHRSFFRVNISNKSLQE
jgi:hypothetical protein